MRLPTRQETEEWCALARDHGFLNDEGQFDLGKFLVVEGEGESSIGIKFITPVAAGSYTEDMLQRKSPPVLFERTAEGDIILPGRWWVSMLEALSDNDDLSAEDRERALIASRHVEVANTFLPVSTDTIDILAPDPDGTLVSHEALKPGTMCLIRLTAK